MASDDFNRADSDNPGTNWANTSLGGGLVKFAIVSNTAGNSSTSGNPATAVRVGTYANNQMSQAVLKSTTPMAGVTVRSLGGQFDAYFGGAPGGASKYIIGKWDNAGSFSTLITHATLVPAVNDVIKLDATGTTLTLFVNGVQKLQTTDAFTPSGSPGLYIDWGFSFFGVGMDDWTDGIADPSLVPTYLSEPDFQWLGGETY